MYRLARVGMDSDFTIRKQNHGERRHIRGSSDRSGGGLCTIVSDPCRQDSEAGMTKEDSKYILVDDLLDRTIRAAQAHDLRGLREVVTDALKAKVHHDLAKLPVFRKHLALLTTHVADQDDEQRALTLAELGRLYSSIRSKREWASALAARLLSMSNDKMSMNESLSHGRRDAFSRKFEARVAEPVRPGGSLRGVRFFRPDRIRHGGFPMNSTRTSPRLLPLALAAVLTTAPASAVSAPTSAAETFAHWAFDRTGTCMGALSGDSADWDGGARCVGDRLGGLLVEEAARLLTEQGRETFGEHFSLVHRMIWSPPRPGAGRGAGRGRPARAPRGLEL